jgi:flavodoxin
MTNIAMKESPPSKKVAIVYASIHHGNTRQIADLLAAQLDADLWTVEEAEGKSLANYRLVGLGSGIYFGRHHEMLLKLVDSWDNAPERLFLFSTAGLPFLRILQHTALRRRVLNKGGAIVGEFCCRGWDTVGPLWLLGGINRKRPNTRDLNRAGRFADALLKQ